MSNTMLLEVERRGLGYEADHGGIAMRVAHLRRSRGELSGELSVAVDSKSLSRGRVNLSSLVARRALSGALAARDGHKEADWPEFIEQFCAGVLNAEATSSPFVELCRRPIPPGPPALLDPILPLGVPSSIFGPGGCGKSTVATAIAVSLASGVEVIPGWKPSHQARIAVLDWEATERQWTERAHAIAAGVGIDMPVGIHYRDGMRPLADQVEQLAAELDRLRVEFLIVDSVGLAAGSAGRDGGDAAETTLRMFAALRVLGRTSLLIDHVAGSDLTTDHVAAKPYGSVYKVNLARGVYELRREQAPTAAAEEALLLHRKANSGPLLSPFGIRTVRGDGTIRFQHCEVTAPELERHSGSTADRMGRLLRNGAMTTAAIAEELGINAATIRQTLQRHQRFVRLDGGRIGLGAFDA